MLNYLLKILALLAFSTFIIFNYYFVYGGHLVFFDGYFLYFSLVVISYIVYKYFQLKKSTKIASFSNLHLIGFFILNLFFICYYFFHLSIIDTGTLNFSFLLFLKIIFFSALPISIFTIVTSFGKFILNKLPNNKNFPEGLDFILSLVLGFISFLTLLTIAGIFGFYNLFVVILILLSFILISYKEMIHLYKGFISKRYVFDIKEGSYMKLLSTELFYIISFTILSIGLVSIFRPFPIGWDDLGVYMNYPHLMAESGNLLSLGAIYSWQVFTGIGYMFGTPVSAFFLNISGLFLSFIFLNIIFSDLLKSDNQEKKSFLDLPIMLSTLFISLPMIVFLTTKDMKVDTGLFFISISAVYLSFKYFISLKKKKEISIIYMLIIGIIVGFSFGIKFTALILIVGILSILSYARFGLLGLFGYLSVFFGIFTYLNLWKMMNVLVNPNNIFGFEKLFGLASISLGVILLAIGFFLKKDNILKYIKEVSIFLLGVFIILTPWIGKNIHESYPNLNIYSILNGNPDNFIVDYSNIYTDEELKDIATKTSITQKRENTITTNEDFLRYFGYENGIVDFVYMPWNLTMQKNQSGEYTNIGFLFLALLPLLFIFLPYKRAWYPLFFIFISISQLLFYIQSENKLIDVLSYSNVSTGSIVGIFTENDNLFKYKEGTQNIYNVDFNSYVSKELIGTSIPRDEIDEKTRKYITEIVKNKVTSEISSLSDKSEENFNNLFSKYSDEYLNDFDTYSKMILDTEVEILEEQVRNNFYSEIEDKVKDLSLGTNLSFLSTPLSEKDFENIKELNNLYENFHKFGVNDIVTLEKKLIENSASQEEIEILKNVWSKNRSINGKIIDFFSKINLPIGYLYLFAGFFLPTLFLIFTLKKTSLNYLFSLNLVFASTYTFLWFISSFGIVWYGITMYFSFLLMIGLGAYYLSNYTEKSGENIYLSKLFESFIFLSLFIIYFLNSVIPDSFSNLKKAGYEQFKVGQISQASSIYLYHKDYKEVLFILNIAEDKRLEFLKEYISDDIIKFIPGIVNEDINSIFSILSTLQSNANLNNQAKYSIENLYKNISNPTEKYKNKENIYRIGTFLKYHISENNKRLLEDSLLFSFNNYIYSSDIQTTIDRFKSVGVKYLLVDLNAATIDQSITKDLTTRYENLLKTFTSENLELISTDSVCLELALDDYKTNLIMDDYMTLAGVNFDSYDTEGNIISRGSKRNQCIQYIDYLLENDLVNNENYSSLLPLKNHFANNNRSISAINSIIGGSYKVLFKIK